MRCAGERSHALVEHRELPAARHASTKVAPNLRFLDLGKGPEEMLGEMLAHVVTFHWAPPTTREA